MWGDDLLILCGEELTTRNGHCIAFATDPGTWFDFRFRARDSVFADFASSISSHGGLVVAGHPHTMCIACRWVFQFENVDVIEVWNGQWGPCDEQALETWDSMIVLYEDGWIPAHGGSDSHDETVPLDAPHVVVLADNLDRQSLIAALKAGHSYIAESVAVTVHNFTVTTFATGEEVQVNIGQCLCAPAGTVVTVTMSVTGAPTNGLARIVSDQGVMQTQLVKGGESMETFVWDTTVSLATYVRGEIRHPSLSMAAMTNPIFLGEEMCNKCSSEDQIIL